jgi:CheY-like chemotaxis protein
LLADDNESDAELTRLAFDQSVHSVELRVVCDGEQCLSFLNKSGPFVDASTPDLLLLDLHMPRLGGIEVLERLLPEQMARIPVVVLTTSDNADDITAAYRLGCKGYFIKPVGFAAFVDMIKTIQDYWLECATHPSHAGDEQ